MIKDNYNDDAFKRYDEAVSYEKNKLEKTKTCPICQGTKFERINGLIVCCTCGLCTETFSNTVYGFQELECKDFNNKFIKELKKLGEKGDDK